MMHGQNAIVRFIQRVFGIGYRCSCGHFSYGPSGATQHNMSEHVMPELYKGLKAGEKKQ